VFEERSGGGDDSTPIVWVIENTGHNLCKLGSGNCRRQLTEFNESLYLTVKVKSTNYEVKANQWATISVNGEVVKQYCTPDKSCSGKSFSCITNFDVASFVRRSSGGSLTIEVSSVGVTSGPCDYEGYPLYAYMSLDIVKSSEPNDNGVAVWIIALSTSAGFLLLLVVLLVVHLHFKNAAVDAENRVPNQQLHNQDNTQDARSPNQLESNQQESNPQESDQAQASHQSSQQASISKSNAAAMAENPNALEIKLSPRLSLEKPRADYAPGPSIAVPTNAKVFPISFDAHIGVDYNEMVVESVDDDSRSRHGVTEL
jgi:hypothetical protein